MNFGDGDMLEHNWDYEDQVDRELFQVEKDIPYCPPGAEGHADRMRTLWLSTPRRARGFATVVWFHGGGLASDLHEHPDTLYSGDTAVAEVRYRVSPQVKAPAYMEDAAAAVAWVLGNIAGRGGDPGRVVVGGMSAGAYLAALVTMDKTWLAPHNFSHHDIKGLALVSGQMSVHFQVKADLGYPGDRYLPVVDKLAPLAHLAADLPPMLLVCGDPACDIPARAEENAYMAASLKALGHPDVRYHSLAGHCHGGTLRSSGYLFEKFLKDIAP